MSYQALARTWRPRTFAEVVGQEHVVRALVNALDKQRLHHALLFTGTRGVGKTTLARIFAKALNCEQGVSSQPCGECGACRSADDGRMVDLLEVDAASRTKVDDTRELLDNVQYAPTHGRFKIYIIDEVHMLSGHSFNALLKTLEEPPPHVQFLLATTDPKKLPVTVLSRCLQFHLKPLDQELIRAQLERIAAAEKVAAEAGALTDLARAADGSLRDGLSLLDQAIAHAGGELTSRQVQAMLGLTERGAVLTLLESIAAEDGDRVLALAAELATQGADFASVLREMALQLYQLSLLRAAPDAFAARQLDAGPLHSLADGLTAEDLQLFYEIAVLGRRDLPLAPDARSGFEMSLLRMLAFRPEAPLPQARAGGGGARAATASPREAPAQPAVADGEPAAAAADTRATTAETAAEHDGSQWQRILAQLDLGGLPREMASHTVLTGQDSKCVTLRLDARFSSLLNEERRRELEGALNAHWEMNRKLVVEIGEPDTETPAQARQRAADEKRQAAVESIHSDPLVKDLVKTFDAELSTDSIRAKD